MQKLIIAGMITVFLVISWTCYMQYDKNKFIEELSQEPFLKQQIDGNKKDSGSTLVDGDSESTQSIQKNASILTSEDEMSENEKEDNVQPNNIRTKMGRKGDALDPGQIPSDNGISPELIKVFTEIQPIYDQIEEIMSELTPRYWKMRDIRMRKEAIESELETVTNPDEGIKLSKEFESLTKLEQEIGSEVLKFQDNKLTPLETELKRILLDEYGFLSQREFEKTHMKTYKTWVSEQ